MNDSSCWIEDINTNIEKYKSDNEEVDNEPNK